MLMAAYPPLLPVSVSDALKRAAQVPKPDSDPLARVRAIEEVLRRARLQHPEFFRTEGGA